MGGYKDVGVKDIKLLTAKGSSVAVRGSWRKEIKANNHCFRSGNGCSRYL
jgi:hypothetical protein